MTTVGHSLVGIAMGMACIPAGRSLWKQSAVVGLCVALASIPDWPLPFWGHRHLAVSHSLFVNLLICGALGWIVGRRGGFGSPKRRMLMVFAIAAWLSHFLLDTLYGDIPGVAILWPFSDALVSLPIPWLKTLPHVPPPFGKDIITIFGLEALTFSPLVILSLVFRAGNPS
jgi:hypothetical protein